jgi:hypothetical protein
MTHPADPDPTRPADPSPGAPMRQSQRVGSKPNTQPQSTMRSLGAFFGEIVKGVRSKPEQSRPVKNAKSKGSGQPGAVSGTADAVADRAAPDRGVTLRRTVVEEVPGDRPGVVVRRTVIEEVQLPPGQSPQG